MSDGPMLHLERKGVVIRKQAPVVVYYCDTPHGIRRTAACGYEAATCQGAKQTCPRCLFAYCAHHFGTHVRGPLYYPRDAWKTVRDSFARQLDRAAETRGKSLVRVNVPRVKPGAG